METRAKTLALCEEAWTKGMPLKKTDDGFPIVMKPSMNCVFRVQGTQDIAYVGLPKTREEVMAFLKTIPRLTADELESAPEGVYTWLLYSKDGSAPMFAASKTETMLELGTVHYSIAISVGATAVHGAGELWKHGNEYSINFLSGTFMDSWRSSLPSECPLETMQSYLQARLKKSIFPYLFRGKVLSFTRMGFVTGRFLSKELTTDKLETYVRAGFVVCIHDKENVDECKRTKGTCKKPMALEEQMKKAGASGWVGVAYDGAQVGVDDDRAKQWMNTRTYDSLKCKPAQKYLDNSSLRIPKGSQEACAIGGRRRKTRKLRRSRRVTRRKL